MERGEKGGGRGERWGKGGGREARAKSDIIQQEMNGHNGQRELKKEEFCRQ